MKNKICKERIKRVFSNFRIKAFSLCVYFSLSSNDKNKFKSQFPYLRSTRSGRDLNCSRVQITNASKPLRAVFLNRWDASRYWDLKPFSPGLGTFLKLKID
jgi:hypothetical protein